MELVAVFLADDVGMNDSGALRLEGGYLGRISLHQEPEHDDPADDLAHFLVVLGRGRPAGGERLAVTVTSSDRPVEFDVELDLPSDPRWWFSVGVPTRALASVTGAHRIEVRLHRGGSDVLSTAWCEYEVGQ